MIQNLIPILQQREKELRQFALAIADQFNITDEAEREQLVAKVLSIYDTNQPLLHVRRMKKAASQLYREMTRAAYIDLIAYLTQLQFIESIIKRAEIYTRESFKQIKSKLNTIIQKVNRTDLDGYVRETFVQSSGKQLNDCIITNETLSLAPSTSARSVSVSNISATIYPVQSQDTYHQTVGDLKTIVRSGNHSGVWATHVYTNGIPEINWNSTISGVNTAPITVRGVVAVIDIVLSAPIALNTLSASFLNRSRIIGIYAQTQNGLEVLRDLDGNFIKTLPAYDIQINNIANPVVTDTYRLVVAVEQPNESSVREVTIESSKSITDIYTSIKNGLTEINEFETRTFTNVYTIGIYNIKLKAARHRSSGIFISDAYRTNVGAIVAAEISYVKEETKPGMLLNRYAVEFIASDGSTERIPVLPSGTSPYIEEVLEAEDDQWIYPSFFVEAIQKIEQVDAGESFTKGQYELDTKHNIIKINQWPNPSVNPKKVHIVYKTLPTNSVGYVARIGEGLYDIKKEKPQNTGYTYKLRRLKPNLASDTETLQQVSIYRAQPIQLRTVEEYFFQKDLKGNELQLGAVPFVPEGNYHPVDILIKPAEDSDFQRVNDRTNWANPLLQPYMLPYEDTGRYEGFLFKNRLYLNTENFYQVKVTYLNIAKDVRLIIQMDTLDEAHTPVVNQYELKLLTQ